MREEGKQSSHQHNPDPSAPNPLHYGTFRGVQSYAPSSQPAIGFPQPAPPPGTISSSSGPGFYAHGYQAVAVPGYAVVEGHPVRRGRLCCCGIGVGWFLFILGFFLASIPWYIGAFLLLFTIIDQREKPGYVACTIAAALALIGIIVGASKGADVW